MSCVQWERNDNKLKSSCRNCLERTLRRRRRRRQRWTIDALHHKKLIKVQPGRSSHDMSQSDVILVQSAQRLPVCWGWGQSITSRQVERSWIVVCDMTWFLPNNRGKKRNSIPKKKVMWLSRKTVWFRRGTTVEDLLLVVLKCQRVWQVQKSRNFVKVE